MYLLVAAVSTVAGTVARELTASPEHVGGAWWVGALWIVGYCALTAAALDPAARALSPEIRPDTNRITPVTLVGRARPCALDPSSRSRRRPPVSLWTACSSAAAASPSSRSS